MCVYTCVSGSTFFLVNYILTKFSSRNVEAHEGGVGDMHVPVESSGWQGDCPLSLPPFAELAFPCIFWEGPSLLFSSFNSRLLLASWPPSSYRVQPTELSRHRAPHRAGSETEAGARHVLWSEGTPANLLLCGCGCVGWARGSCLFDSFFS